MECKTKPQENVLFVCTENSCRSQMAEGFLRAMAPNRFRALSAGMMPAQQIDPVAIRVMGEVGIDIARQHPKSVKDYLGVEQIRWLVIVCRQANRMCPHVWPMLAPDARLYWPFVDPCAGVDIDAKRLPEFRRVRDQIRDKVADWLATLL